MVRMLKSMEQKLPCNESRVKSEINSIDEQRKSSRLIQSDPWSSEELIKACPWSSSFGGLNLPHNWNELDITMRIEILKKRVHEFFPNSPKSLETCLIGTMLPADFDGFPCRVSDWLDRDKLARGQRFARNNIFSALYANSLSLYVIYSFEDELKPIIITGRSSEPYTAFKRYLSTACRVRNWITSDPWTEGTPACRNIRAVNRLHDSIRDEISNMNLSELNDLAKMDKPLAARRELLLKDFRHACPVAKLRQGAHLTPEYREQRPIGLNQGEMAMTTFGFIGFIILYPEAFGVHGATEEDLDAFCHLWRGLTYLLGVCDELNFCNGSLRDIKQRSHDYVKYWLKPNLRNMSPEFEHMMRCIYEGLDFYIPGVTYDGALLYLTEILGLSMPRLRALMTFSSWIKFSLFKTLLRYPCRLKWIKLYLNYKTHTSLDGASAFDKKKHLQLHERSERIVSNILVEMNRGKYDDIVCSK